MMECALSFSSQRNYQFLIPRVLVCTDSILPVSYAVTTVVARPKGCELLSPLACLSNLTATVYAGEKYASQAVKKPRSRDKVVGEDENVKGGGRQVGEGRLLGVLAFDSIKSADGCWYILGFA